MLGLSVIFLFNLIFNVNSNLAESSANCSEKSGWLCGIVGDFVVDCDF